jgi:hypothetical protein
VRVWVSPQFDFVSSRITLESYLLRISRPGSAELIETRLPLLSRVVRNLSLVRPVIWFRSSRTMLEVSLYPVVTEPMILRLPSRTKSFFSMVASSYSIQSRFTDWLFVKAFHSVPYNWLFSISDRRLPDMWARWLGEYIHELPTFPANRFDDQTDSTAQALDWAKGGVPYLAVIEYYKEEAAKLGLFIEGLTEAPESRIVEDANKCPNRSCESYSRVGPQKRCSKCGHQWPPSGSKVNRLQGMTS